MNPLVMSRKHLVTAAFLALLAVPGTANAAVADFNGQTDFGCVFTALADGGLTFTTTFAQCLVDGSDSVGAHNGSTKLINGYSTLHFAPTAGGTFDLNSLDLGISYYNDLADDQVTITGNVNGGGTMDFLAALTQSFQIFTVNMLNLDSVDITTFAFGSGYIAVDNIVYTEATSSVPEPVTLSLLGAGLAGIAAMRRRKA